MNLVKKTIIAVVATPLLLLAYMLADFISFGGYEANKGVMPAETKSAIVVLTGGRGRADEGLRHLKEGRQEVLILSGVNASASLDAIFPGKLTDVERERIVLEKGSTSTIENAVEVRKILSDRKLGSVVLITSMYHMRRARYVFERVLPPEVAIHPRPIASANFDSARWWERSTLALLTVEFSKYCLTVAKFSVSPPRPVS